MPSLRLVAGMCGPLLGKSATQLSYHIAVALRWGTRNFGGLCCISYTQPPKVFKGQ
jgi:hypothetical protein